jgi:predicted solute-binding protein
MYVSDLTRDMGEKGKKGLETLFERAAAAGLIEPPPVLTFIE